MKRKSLLTVIIVMLLSVSCLLACGKKTSLAPYTEFTGGSLRQVEIDENMSIDGVIDEEVWADCKNTQYVRSKHALSTDANPKEMSVYTYFGEKAFYIAFDVKDDAIYYNPSRTRSRNTGVELYFTNAQTLKLGTNCYSLRISPTGEEGEQSASVGAYRATASEWTSTNLKGSYKAMATVEGTINEGKTDDEGYAVEIAVSYDLLGGKANSYQMAAAFVQTGTYDRSERYANTFLEGTSYLGVGTWKIISNDGSIADKYAYLDSQNAIVDEGMTVDGVLDEAAWTNEAAKNRGKSYTHTDTGVSLTTYTYFTQSGVYIGLDSNDSCVYYNPDHTNEKYNTGAELLIVAGGETSITESAVQLRYNVGGRGLRYVGNPSTQYPWKVDYFPAQIAGSVKNGEINTSTADGWQGEIFIPWKAFGITDPGYMDQIAIFPALYHTTSYTAETTADGWHYLPPGTSVAWGSNYGNNLPQETFFRFTKADGFIFNGVTVSDVDVDTKKVEMVEDDERYFVDVKVMLGNAVNNKGYTTPDATPSGSITAPEGINFSIADKGNGIYRLYLDKSQLALYKNGVEFSYKNTVGNLTDTFTVMYDAFMTLDGIPNIQDEIVSLWASPVEVVNHLGSAVNNFEYLVVPRDNAIYIVGSVSDAILRNTSAASIALLSGDNLRRHMTVRLDFLANGSLNTYSYDHRVENGSDPWASDDLKEHCSYVVTQNEDGYFFEARIDWSIFTNRVDKTSVNALASVIMDGNDKKEYPVRVYGDTLISAETWTNADNYLRFNAEGFAPDKAFATSDLLYINGETKDGKYTDEVKLSYIPRGGLGSDIYAEKSFTVAEMTGGANPPSEARLTLGTLGVTVPVRFIKPNAAAVDESKIEHALDFNLGADDMQAAIYTNYLEQNKTGNAFAASVNPLSVADNAYISNMHQRALRLPVVIGEDSFSVSMMMDTTAIREHLTSHYSYILMGTGNVDNGNEGSGFSVRLRGDSLSIRFPGKYYSSIPFDMSNFDGWRYVTMTFNREGSQDTFFMYVDGVRVVRYEVEYDGSYDVDGVGKLGIGVPGIARDTETGYTNKDVMIDNLVFYRGILDERNLYNVYGFVRDKAAGRLFTLSDDTFDYTFNDFEHTENATAKFTVKNGAGESVTAVEFTGNWKNFVTAPTTGNEFTFAATREQLKQLSGVNGYKVNGVTKYARISYLELDNLALKDAAVTLMRKNKSGSSYIVEVYVTANGVPVCGDFLTFSSPSLTIDSEVVANGYFKLTLSTAEVETLSEPAVVTVSVKNDNGVKPVKFELNYIGLTEAERAEIASGVDAFLDFEDGITDKIGNYATAMGKGSTADITDGAFNANTSKNTVKVSGLSLGTDDFTLDFMVKLDQDSYASSNANYELITSTITDSVTSGLHGDGHIGTFQLSAHGINNKLRLALGRNDQQTNGENNPYINGSFNKLKPGEWQRITLVVDRAYEIVADHTNTSNRYDADGNYMGEPASGTSEPFYTYAAPEKVKVTVYIGGVKIDEKFYWMSGQSLGDGNLYIGGNLARAEKKAAMDNVTLIRGTLSDEQVLCLDSYYDLTVANGAWNARVADPVIRYDVTGETVSKEVTITKAAACELTVNPTLANAGSATIAAKDAANGVYTVTIPCSELDGWTADGTRKYIVIDGVKKPLDIVFYPLNNLFVSAETTDLWKKDITDGNFVIPVTVFVDEAKTQAVSDITSVSFKANGTAVAATAKGEGRYELSVPTALMTDGSVEVIAFVDGVTGAGVVFAYNEFGAAELRELASLTDIYYDFNGDFVNTVDGIEAAYVYDTDDAADDFVDGKYYNGNQFTRAIAGNYTLGTDSFSVSMVINTQSLYAGLNEKHHNNILFGTTTVDDNASGITVRARAKADRSSVDAFQIKVMGTYIYNKAGVDLNAINNALNAGGEDCRWTFTFERDLASKKMTARVYIDGKQVVSVVDTKMALDNALDGASHRIAIGGSAEGRENYNSTAGYGYIKYDDFLLVKKVLTPYEIKGLESHIGDLAAEATWTAPDLAFDFTQVAAQGNADGSYSCEYRMLGTTATDGATLVNAPEGITLTPTQTAGTYTLKLTAGAIAAINGVQTLSVKIGDRTDTLRVIYLPLGDIYLNLTEVKMWSDDAGVDGYIIPVRVTADKADGSVLVSDAYGTTFTMDGSTLNADYADGVYSVAIPTAAINDGEQKTITVSVAKNGVEEKSFTVLLNLTAEEKAAMLNATDVYMGFDGSLADIAGGRTATMYTGTESDSLYADNDLTNKTGDKALAVSTKSQRVQLSEVEIGAEDFTMAFDLKLDKETWSPTEGSPKATANYEIITSMDTDRFPNTFQFSAHAQNQKFRIAVGRNGQRSQDFYFNNSTAKIKAGKFQRIVLVIDRKAGVDENATTSYVEYGANGDPVNTKFAEGTAPSYSSPEIVKAHLYMDGEPVQTKTWYFTYQSIGVGRLFFGGESADASSDTAVDYPSWIDNFTLYRKALSQREVKSIGLYDDEYKSSLGASVSDLTLDYETVTGAGEALLDTEGTIAEIKGLPDGVTLGGAKDAYKLVYTAEGLAALSGETELTAVFAGGVERAFSVSYEKLYATDITVSDIVSAGVKRTVKISKDKAGTMPVSGVVFGEGVTATEAANAGEYEVTVASAATATYDITKGAASGKLSVTQIASLVKSTDEPAYYNNNTNAANSVQGGKVYKGVDLGADSFTVSLMVDNLTKINNGNGGGNILFSTCQTDDSYGVTSYIADSRFRFRVGGVGSNFAIYTKDASNINKAENAGWHNITMTFDRSKFNKLTITVYFDYELVGSVEKDLISEMPYSFGLNKQFVFGSTNAEGMTERNKFFTSCYDWHPGFAGELIAPMVVDINEVKAYMQQYEAGLPDGKTLNSYTYS